MSIPALSLAVMLASAPAEMPAPQQANPSSVASSPETPASDPDSTDSAQQPTAPTAVPDAAPQHTPTDGAQQEQAGIVVTAKPRPDPGDPVEAVNEATFSAVQSVDTAFVGPVAMTYKSALPNPVRSGVRNFFNNLQEPIVFLNFLLQLKPGKAAETLGRFTVNSTVGVAGLVDIAKKKPFSLPRRPNGLAYTLGYYGVKPGPYLFLPLIGPTTVRDLFGRWVDLLVLPVGVGKPFTDPIYGASALVVRSLDDRAEADERLRKLREGPKDHYKALRDDYLETRQAEIDALRGLKKTQPPAENDVPTAPASTDTTQPETQLESSAPKGD